VANPENSQLGNQTLPAKEQQAIVGLLVIYKTDQTTLSGEDTMKELTDEPTTEEANNCAINQSLKI